MVYLVILKPWIVLAQPYDYGELWFDSIDSILDHPFVNLHWWWQFVISRSTQNEPPHFDRPIPPDIPSVLIETGFISNPTEEFRLTSAAYQTRLCQAIMGGVKAYFWDYPPHGTRIEALSNANRRLLTQQSGPYLSRKSWWESSSYPLTWRTKLQLAKWLRVPPPRF